MDNLIFTKSIAIVLKKLLNLISYFWVIDGNDSIHDFLFVFRSTRLTLCEIECWWFGFCHPVALMSWFGLNRIKRTMGKRSRVGSKWPAWINYSILILVSRFNIDMNLRTSVCTRYTFRVYMIRLQEYPK